MNRRAFNDKEGLKMARKSTSTASGDKVLSDAPPSEELRKEIEQLAYELYCRCGYEHGHDVAHWVEAERQVVEHYKRGHNTSG